MEAWSLDILSFRVVRAKSAKGWARVLILVLAPVIQKVDSAIHWINYYPVDNAIGFRTTYQLGSELSGG